VLYTDGADCVGETLSANYDKSETMLRDVLARKRQAIALYRNNLSPSAGGLVTP